MGPIRRGKQAISALHASLGRALVTTRQRTSRLFGPVLAWAAPLAVAGARPYRTVARWLGIKAVQQVLHVLSIVILLGSLSAYGSVWLEFNEPMLTDPDLQSDDARTSVFPFHRYASDPALTDDPLTDEMLSLVPAGIWLMYRVLVPFSDVFIAPKVVQGLAFLVLLVAGGVLWRSRRAGLGAGVLLVFFLCHDWFVVERVAGGLGRAFGFPCFALWLAGVLAHRRWARVASTVLAALTYPTVMLLLLAAEGLYAVRGLTRRPWKIVVGRLRRYAVLVALSLLAVLPSVVGDEDRGPVHSLEQAQLEPAFGRGGRLWVLPFAEPSKVFLSTYLAPLATQGESPFPKIKRYYQANAEAWATTFIMALLLAGLIRIAPSPTAALAFTAGAVILYLLSRLLAFQLYSPERYYSFGMRMAAFALLVSVPARLFCTLRRRPRAIINNLFATLLLVGVWACTGDGQKHPSGMFISAERDRALYEFVRTLPKHARFATHPNDGDGIPYFGARATMGTFETLQPWFVDSWRRQKQRCQATLRALYATDRSEVLDYADRFQVTHFLINRHRYRSSYVAKSSSFQPFTSYARMLLKRRKLKDLVMANVPDEAVVFQHKQWEVVSVDKLTAAWR